MVHLRVKNKTEILTSIARTKGEFRGPGSSVSIATGYGLDGPGIESRWGRDFPNLCRPALGPTSLMYNESRVFPGGKERPGCEADPSPLLVPWSRKIRAIPLLPLLAVRPVQSLSAYTVELYLYSPNGPSGLYRASVPVQGDLNLYLGYSRASLLIYPFCRPRVHRRQAPGRHGD